MASLANGTPPPLTPQLILYTGSSMPFPLGVLLAGLTCVFSLFSFPPAEATSHRGVGKATVIAGIFHNCEEALRREPARLTSASPEAVGALMDFRVSRLGQTGTGKEITPVHIVTADGEPLSDEEKQALADRIRGVETHYRVTEADGGIALDGFMIRGRRAIEGWENLLGFFVDEREAHVSHHRTFKLWSQIIGPFIPIYYSIFMAVRDQPAVPPWGMWLIAAAVMAFTGAEYLWKHPQTMDYNYRRDRRRITEFLEREDGGSDFIYVGSTSALPVGLLEMLSSEGTVWDFLRSTSQNFKSRLDSYSASLAETAAVRWLVRTIEDSLMKRARPRIAKEAAAEVRRWASDLRPELVEEDARHFEELASRVQIPSSVPVYAEEWVLVDRLYYYDEGEPVLILVTRRSGEEPMDFQPGKRRLSLLERIRRSLEEAQERLGESSLEPAPGGRSER